MPSIGDLNAMRGSAEAMLNVSGENFHYGNPGEVIDADIEFLGDQVKITAPTGRRASPSPAAT